MDGRVRPTLAHCRELNVPIILDPTVGKEEPLKQSRSRRRRWVALPHTRDLERPPDTSTSAGLDEQEQPAVGRRECSISRKAQAGTARVMANLPRYRGKIRHDGCCVVAERWSCALALPRGSERGHDRRISRDAAAEFSAAVRVRSAPRRAPSLAVSALPSSATPITFCPRIRDQEWRLRRGRPQRSRRAWVCAVCTCGRVAWTMPHI